MDAQTNEGGSTQAPPAEIYPSALREAERELIAARRNALQLGVAQPTLGVAVSGGGIRSATFALGLFQALARRDLLKRIDFLSTVSGGGYFGGFFGKLFLPGAGTKSESPAASAERVRDALLDSRSGPIWWLRENGRYIAPTGAGDYMAAAAIYLRNWSAVQFVVGITLLTLFLLSNTVRAWFWHAGPGDWLEKGINGATLGLIWVSPWVVLPLAVAAVFLVPLCVAYWLTQQWQVSEQRSWTLALLPQGPIIGLCIVLFAAALALWAPELGSRWFPQTRVAKVSYLYVVATCVLAFLAYLVSYSYGAPNAMSVARNRLSRWLGAWLVVFVMLLVFALVDTFGQTAYALWTSGKVPVALTGVVTSALLLLARQFAGYLTSDKTKQPKGLRIPMHLVGLVVGLALALIVATFWNAVAHGALWQGGRPTGDPGGQLMSHYAPGKPQVSLSAEQYIKVAAPEQPAPSESERGPAKSWVTAAFIVALLLSIATGHNLTFLNLSSIQQFYAARLARAYLGASNPRRTAFASSTPDSLRSDTADEDIEQTLNVTRADPRDDVAYKEYRPERHGGPVHLVNVTINETIAGTSQLEQRDRKGLGMAVGPCGISVARVHHALWNDDAQLEARKLVPVKLRPGRFAVFGERTFDAEPLSLGQWVAISGAAFTTGLGARTNLGLSLLLGLSNVRIGYWWDSNIAPGGRDDTAAKAAKHKPADWLEFLFPAQLYLSDELLARFHGPHRQRWYLSDGGHYENTAVYELLRRRLPVILLSDNGGDEDYTFADLGNLVRKARIDFDAEIRFLEEAELNELLTPSMRQIIGTPAELQRRVGDAATRKDDGLEGNAYSRCHAIIARVYYDRAMRPGGVLIVVKPSLAGDEPIDLLQYHSEHPTFPQETTLDQFFDEAQWESYRKLGSHIGDKLFDAVGSLDDFIDKINRREA